MPFIIIERWGAEAWFLYASGEALVLSASQENFVQESVIWEIPVTAPVPGGDSIVHERSLYLVKEVVDFFDHSQAHIVLHG